jgi:autotransporter-associated beta strand protein
MFLTSWQKLVNPKFQAPPWNRRRPVRWQLFRPLQLEALEDRLVPATHTWTGAASDLWSDNANWTGGSPAGDSNADLVFPSGAMHVSTNNDLSDLTIHSITLTGTGYVLGGNAITLNAGIAASAASLAISMNISLGGGQSFRVDAGANLGISGVLSGTGSLTKSGTAMLVLSGTNIYTGATTVTAGTLQLGASSGLPSGTAVTVAGGATLDSNNFSFSIGSLAGAGSVALGSATLTIGNNNTNTTFSGSFTGSGNVTKVGTGNITISGNNNSVSGTTTINAGTLTFGSETTFLTTELDFASGTLQLTRNDATGNRSQLIPGHLKWTGGRIAGPGTILSGSLDIMGATQHRLDGPTLNISGSVNLSGTLDFNEGGLLFHSATSISGQLNWMGGTMTGSGTTTITGTLNLMGPNPTLSGGTLDSTAGRLIGTGTLTLVQGTLKLGDSVPLLGGLNWTGGTLQGTGTTMLSGPLNISGDNSKTLDGLVLDSAGPVTNGRGGTWSGRGGLLLSHGAKFINDTILNMQDDAGISQVGGGDSTFTNRGTFCKCGGGTDYTRINVSFTNEGTVDVETGKVFLASEFTNFDNQTLTGGTYLVKGILLFLFANIQTNAATITLDGPAARIVNQSNVDALAHLAVNTGALTLRNHSLETNAALVDNEGTLTLVGLGSSFTADADLRNAGTLIVGAGTVVNVVVNFDMQMGATLSVELAARDHQFGLVTVGGTATLDGTLMVTLADDVPGDNDTFTILTSDGGITGQFAAHKDPPDWPVDIMYSPNQVTLGRQS